MGISRQRTSTTAREERFTLIVFLGFLGFGRGLHLLLAALLLLEHGPSALLPEEARVPELLIEKPPPVNVGVTLVVLNVRLANDNI